MLKRNSHPCVICRDITVAISQMFDRDDVNPQFLQLEGAAFNRFRPVPTRAKAKANGEASIRQAIADPNRSAHFEAKPPKSARSKTRCAWPRRSCTRRRASSVGWVRPSTPWNNRTDWCKDRVRWEFRTSPVLHPEQPELCGDDGVHQRAAARGHHRARSWDASHGRGRRSGTAVTGK